MSTYTIVGGGAIGGTLALPLAQAGHDVLIVDRDAEHVKAIREHGLTIRHSGESDRVVRLRVMTPDELGEHHSLDKVLLAVKSQATESALDFIAPRLTDDGYVASVQNGLNEGTITTRVGAKRTLGAFVNFAADVVGPGIIQYGGPGALVVGEVDGTPSPRVDALVADLAAWGPAQASTNVVGFEWSKMGYAVMLIASALADEPMADLISGHRPVMHRGVREVFAVAAAEGVTLEPFDAFDPAGYVSGADDDRADAATDKLVAWLHTLDKKRSGIWRDIAVRRRATEVDAQYVPIVERADKYGVEVPTLRALLQYIRLLEAGEIEMSERLLHDLDAITR